MVEVSILAVLVAAISSFVLGGLWYSPLLFGKAWLKESGAPTTPGHPAKVFGISFICSLLAAYAFAVLMGSSADLATALHMGLLVGVCFVATSFGINYQFVQRSGRLWLIDGGYHICQFLLYGLVLGLWP
ncbi:DUF1761 domain-containing protein [Rheinheimera sp. UJ63]|uniref:DUF1761 domain-containing protein n=1 Tax=Rheinheimera sp. UJ63 TaxID=2910157 RepID=UPI001F1A0653|nr:DUF1761 domain-containing protein [Rheinheimera sp. UJ63]MCF4009540.1 DUF1761 domain-containing protein [Rheinheimera sp. UJ63]